MLHNFLQNSAKSFLQSTTLIKGCLLSRNITTACSPLYFQVTNCLMGEPLKKKRRLDPAIVRAREDRRRRRIEKQIRKMEKNPRQLKPIEECEVPEILVKDEKKLRVRRSPQLSEEELEYRVLTFKQWSSYRLRQHLADVQMIDRILFSQQKALDELRKESEELYQEALQIDPQFIPVTLKGPVLTPIIKNYESPDGEYIDTSKKW
ncbi:mitochondrial ribosomal protein L40 [Lycorma delicatula]|uniref:mitochondrial ribosomal protein L40 n=1 Tax=Lycorma delicatula TaxID=130591 RepID=UPI003F50F88D